MASLTLICMLTCCLSPTLASPDLGLLFDSIIQGISEMVWADTCVGTIKLTNQDAVHVVNTDVTSSREFGTVETVTVEGNCCWRVATRNNGGGETRDFRENVINRNHGKKVKSVTKIEC